MRWTHLFALMLLAASSLAASAARAQAPADAHLWSNGSALTLPEGRVEGGLSHATRWGVDDNIEVGAHPLLEPIWPHVEAKVRWLHRGAFTLSTWHRVSYPTRLLNVVSREGTAGLLPANTLAPIVVGFDTSFFATLSSPNERFHGTLELGLSLAPRLRRGDSVVLDFPFLYSRFAAVSSFGSTYAGLAFTGVLSDHFSLSADLRFTNVDVVPHGYILEEGASLTWYPTKHFGLALGYRVAHGRYPVGVRTHWMPTIDLSFGSGG